MKIKISVTMVYLQKHFRISQLKNNVKKINKVKVLRFVKTKVANEALYGEKVIKIQDADVDNIVTLKFIETRNNSKYLIGYLGQAIRHLVLILPKMNGYVRTLEDKNRYKDKNEINKLESFRKVDHKKRKKSITLFVLRLKTCKILNVMFNQLMMKDI